MVAEDLGNFEAIRNDSFQISSRVHDCSGLNPVRPTLGKEWGNFFDSVKEIPGRANILNVGNFQFEGVTQGSLPFGQPFLGASGLCLGENCFVFAYDILLVGVGRGSYPVLELDKACMKAGDVLDG